LTVLGFKTAFVQGGLFNAVSRAKYSRKRLYSALESFTVDYGENQPTYFGRHPINDGNMTSGWAHKRTWLLVVGCDQSQVLLYPEGSICSSTPVTVTVTVNLFA
jgi:hypothetical protein